MMFSDEQQGHLLHVARARALQRLVVSDDAFAERIALTVMGKLESSTVAATGSELEAYVCRLVDHEIASHFRRQNMRLRNGHDRVSGPAEALALFVTGASGGSDVHADTWLALYESLDERQRQLVSYMTNGVAQHEIARKLGYASPAVVKVTVNRLRNRLRAQIAAQRG